MHCIHIAHALQVRGEVYGLAHVAERFSSRDALRALHPQTCAPGLYLSGCGHSKKLLHSTNTHIAMTLTVYT